MDKDFHLKRNSCVLALLAYAVFVGSSAAAKPEMEGEHRQGAPTRAGNVAWRFDGNGRFPDIHPPLEWQADRNVLWKTPIDIGGYSSPIVVKDRVFVTAEMGSLACLDVADGKVLWRKDLFSDDSKDLPADISKKLARGIGRESKQSTPTPASNGERVFYINATGLCACYDLQGNPKWMRIVETAEDEEHFSSSPVFLGDRIILSWGCLLALDAKDGHTLWKAGDARPTHGTPAIATIGGEAVAITPGGDIVKLINGEIVCSGLFKSTYTTPIVEGNVLYVIDAEARALQLPETLAKGMKLKELWKTELGGEFMASPAYQDGLFYTMDSKKCRLYVLDAKTGELVTGKRVVDAENKTETSESDVKIKGLSAGNFAYASPAVAEKRVYFFDDSGNTAVLEAGRTYKPLRVNKLDDAIIGTPFFYKDVIIIRGNKTVYCIGAKP